MKMRAIILWQKRVGAGWLNAHEGRLETFAPGRVAIISRPGRALSLVHIVCRSEAQAAKLIRDFGGRAQLLPRGWEKIFQPPPHRPIHIGKRLLIVARREASATEQQLIIPAAGAFGTGEHATTAMCLRLLEETTRSFSLGWRILDVGTGSGILALAARRFGAGPVLAIDHDPRALAHARQNVRLNRIHNVKFVRQDFLRWKPDAPYDIITANLFSELLIAALPIIKKSLKAKGCVILSGILRDQTDRLVRASRAAGFWVEELRRRGKWIALLLRMGRSSARSEWNRKL